MIAYRRFWLGFTLAWGLALASVSAQSPGTTPQAGLQRDSTGALPPSIPPGTQAAQDSLGKPVAGSKPDTLARPKSRGDSVIVVKHGFNHREQIITGSVIMTCLALIMVAMNNYNPR
jgi:hypothetical protein